METFENNSLSIKITGEAGKGIFTIGQIIAKIFQKQKLNIVYTNDYPSLIKGGHNSCFVKVSNQEIYAQAQKHDILICLNEKTVESDMSDLKQNGILITNDKLDSTNLNLENIKLIQLDKKSSNMNYLGIVLKILNQDIDLIKKVIKHKFKNKSQKIQNQILSDIETSYNNTKNEQNLSIPYSKEKKYDKLLMDGNTAIAIGAIKAGVKFIGEYPMAPSTSILHYLKKNEQKYNLIVKQTEDEIASIMSIIGASYTGARSMTATSGGGFSLMQEALGFAATSETPIVVFNIQRSGSSTGLPTFTAQADLNSSIYASHSENPYIILAPGDINDCFYYSFEAFNLAEITQTPVIVLSDKYLASTQTTVENFDNVKLKINRGKYNFDGQRYEFTDDNISPRPIPYKNDTNYIATSYEHEESGFSSDDPTLAKKMLDKRFNKLDILKNKEFNHLIRPKIYGNEESDLTLISWGSTKGSCLQAVEYINNNTDKKVNLLHFVLINPFDIKYTKSILEKSKKTLIIEGNKNGQFKNLLTAKTGINIDYNFNKYDGRQFTTQEIVDKIMEVLK